MSSKSLVHQRCFNHLEREAVAKCPACGRFYCRECITPHADRVICAPCLKKEDPAEAPAKRRFSTRWLLAIKAFTAFVIAWLFFSIIAGALLKIPSSFHDGQTIDPITLDDIQAIGDL